MIDEIIKTLRRFAKPEEVERAVAQRAQTTLQEAVAKTLSAGETSEGQVWAERKAGGRAYANAAKRITTRADGNLLTMTLSGPEVCGHLVLKGTVKRQMLPDAGAGIPRSVATALTDAAKDVFERWTK